MLQSAIKCNRFAILRRLKGLGGRIMTVKKFDHRGDERLCSNTLSILSSILQTLSSILPITLPITLPVCRYTGQTLSHHCPPVFPRTATLVHDVGHSPRSATVLSCIHTNTRRPIHAAPGFKPYLKCFSIYSTLVHAIPRTPQLALLYACHTHASLSRPHS